jgi:predicted SAM-dependent methyltransferase
VINCLNLGCGQRFHSDWLNLDLHPVDKSVQLWDLQNDLPFPDGSFDVVYHSHVLEHFSKADGLRLLERCCRVLRPNGVIRIAVPDLEAIARLYLEALGKSLDGDPIWRQRYEWILLEMYDQTAREAPGGEMLVYLRRDPIPEREFVASRLGSEFRRMSAESSLSSTQPSKGRIGSFLSRALARLALGKKGIRAHDAGIFRLSGEVHRWMYDRYSLAKLLESAGFCNTEAVGPAESRIPNWNDFCLDIEPDGSVYKPDSLYMEASRR